MRSTSRCTACRLLQSTDCRFRKLERLATKRAIVPDADARSADLGAVPLWADKEGITVADTLNVSAILEVLSVNYRHVVLLCSRPDERVPEREAILGHRVQCSERDCGSERQYRGRQSDVVYNLLCFFVGE